MYHKLPLQPANRKKRRFPRILLWLLLAAGLAAALVLYLVIQILQVPETPAPGQPKTQGAIPPYGESSQSQTPTSQASTTTATYLDDEGRSQAAATAPEAVEAAPDTSATAVTAPVTTAPATTATASTITTRATTSTTKATAPTTLRAAPTTAPRPQAAQAEKPIYTVQFGAFLSPARAKRLQAQLKKKGVKTRLDLVTDDKGKQWYKVRVGQYPTKKEARNAQRAYNRKSGIKTIIGQAAMQ